ncbi:MAG: glycosyltransferase [Spartobacteria bacterium]|nr:glycosyltransferase [Spartobacteria bacterium]
MRLLFLTSKLPHPQVAGGHVIVYQRIARLAQKGHEIGVLAFEGPGDRERTEMMGTRLLEIELVAPPAKRSWPRRLFDYFFSRVPPMYLPLRSEAMAKKLGEMVYRSRYDAVIAEFSVMGQYLYCNPYLSAVRRLISCHRSDIVTYRTSRSVRGFSLALLRDWMQMKGLSKYEFSMYRAADRVLVLTPQERYNLLEHAPNLMTSVIPSGVDTRFFRPAKEQPTEAGEHILFTGYYCDTPNEDAVLWFCRQVWPRLRAERPHLNFLVVGPEPTPAMRDIAAKDPRIIITGMVDDLRAYLARAQVFVCPVRLGSGMRGKILEAMAAGVPVVSTSLGVEGIPAQIGNNCFLADTPDIMAQYISLLLDDAPLRQSIAQHAREMVSERFSWRHSIESLEKVLRNITNRN